MQGRDELAIRVEQQRAKVQALELAAQEREQKQALYDQRYQQRQVERRKRSEDAAQDLLRRKAVAEARRAQDAEDRQLAREQRLARITELEKKKLVRDQQDQQHRPDRQARDGACMQAVLRYEAWKAKEAQEAGEKREAREVREAREAKEARGPREATGRRMAKREERERLAKEQELTLLRVRFQTEEARRVAGLRAKLQTVEGRRLAELRIKELEQAIRSRQDKQRSGEEQDDDQLPFSPGSPVVLGRPKLTRAEIDERQAARTIRDEQRREHRSLQDEAGRQAIQRYETALQAQNAQQKSLSEGRISAFDGVLPSFLDEEYQYMKQASADFPEEITSYNQMKCMRDYQRAISDASRRLPCGICGGLFQEDEMVSIGLQAGDLQYFLQRTNTAPDRCAVKDDTVSLCTACNSAIAKRAIPPLSAGNFVNCLFCQDYPEVLKNLNTVEEAFIARAHVVGIFLKLTSGAKRGISYRGSRGHSVAVRQDPSELLKILPAARLRDYTTITVSWDRGAPPSEENLARFCSVDKAKVVNALLWLCANNPVYKSVVVDYSVLDSWPDHHIPQEIRDAFITLGSEPGSTDTPVEDEREGYATSLRDGLFENELDAEVEDTEPGSILSRSFFSDLHGQDLHSTPATLASLQAILQEQDSDRSGPGEDDAIDVQDDEEGAPNDNSRLPHISYKTAQHLPPMSAFTDPDYFTAAFPTLFPFGIGGHLGDANGDRPEEVSLKAFARYTMLHHSLL